MVVVKMQGRLGNQLFCHAFGLAVQALSGEKVFCDCLNLDSGFASPVRRLFYWMQIQLGRRVNKLELASMGLFVRRASVWQLGCRQFRVVNEHEIDGVDGLLELLMAGRHLYFDGFWQSSKWFSAIEGRIRREFRFQRPLPDSIASLLFEIRNCNSVAVHVRRGDYVANPRTAAAHNICGLAYYKVAIEAVRSRVADAHFYVFSDDIAWCKENLGQNGCIIEFVETVQHGVPHADIELMMNCRHFIIANSSYSWWAAYLGADPSKVVVAPAVWNRMHLDSHPQCDGWVTLPVV